MQKESLQEGFRQGFEKGMLLAIENLMQKQQISAEEAMGILSIEGEERSRYAEKLKKK